MLGCETIRHKRMRGSWIKKNRRWNEVDRKGTEHNACFLMGILNGYMIHKTMFIRARLDIGGFGWWLTTTKGLLGIRNGGYMILGTLSNIVT